MVRIDPHDIRVTLHVLGIADVLSPRLRVGHPSRFTLAAPIPSP